MKKIFLVGALLSSLTLPIFSMEKEENEQVKAEETIVTQPASPTFLTSLGGFCKRNWLPLLGFTSLTAYCVYDRQALPQALSWTKTMWQTLPALIKGGIYFGIGYTGYTKLFERKPLCNNEKHIDYIDTAKKMIIEEIQKEQLKMIQNMHKNQNSNPPQVPKNEEVD